MRLHNLLLLAIVISTAAALSCMDDNGSPVDWFAFIKINSSFSYAYMDANSPSFRQSNFQSSSATSGALSHTLSPLYAGSDTSHIFYNDEKPSGSTSSTRAHAKGILGIDANLAGFWLVHSTPRTPEGPTDSPTYPGILSNEEIYGQSFLCITVAGAETFETIAQALFLDWPNVYDSQMSSAVTAAVPTLVDVVAGKHSTSASCSRSDVHTVGGRSFSIFAKSAAWGQELYSDCIAPALGADVLYVESWIRGDQCPPACGAHQVLDVDTVHTAGWAWRETQDHSKWAVTDTGSMACMGDINRMTSQSKRGGGSVCGSVLGPAMRGLVSTLKDTCGGNNATLRGSGMRMGA